MRIAIAGYGVEGRVNYSYFSARYPEAEVVIVDERAEMDELPTGAQSRLGDGVFDSLDDFDMTIRTAGLAPDRLKTSGKVWSATNEFFAECPAQIIGVTGTKGKGTTASLIASMLRAEGKTVHLLGNIGVPALELLPDIEAEDVVVYELSSFQLWDIEYSPHIAVVLMVEQDHLDVHGNMQDYVEAKARITKYQSADDTLIYHPSNEYAAQIAQRSAAKKIRYQSHDNQAARVESNTFFIHDHAICSVDTLHLVGDHNQENAAAAITVVRLLGVSDEAVTKGLGDFTGLEHRLQYVAEVDGVCYYDDSIATTPGSAIAALAAFDQPKTIILGGSDKGADYADLARAISQYSADISVVLIGSNADKIHSALAQLDVDSTVVNLGMVGMDEAVGQARKLTSEGGVVILSPAAASFDQYSSYHDRGEQFIKAVRGRSETTVKGHGSS